MVRRCIVPNCKNHDGEILSHRFPKPYEQFKKWVDSLKIIDRTNEELLKSFVVCTIHFDKKDYRNELSNKLNTTAIPKLTGHTPRVTSKIITSPDDISPCVEDEPDNNTTINMDSIQIMKPNILTITPSSTTTQTPISDVAIISPSDTTISDSHDILNISMESSILMYEISEYDNSTNQIIIQCNEYDSSQKADYLGGEQHSESDVEVIDMNEINDDQELIEPIHLQSVSEGVSLISTDDNTSPIYFDSSEKNVTDHSCQVDTDELLKNSEKNIINNDGDDNDEYQDMDRKELIKLINEQKRKISEMDIKLKEFQKAHSKLVQSMDAFKILINTES